MCPSLNSEPPPEKSMLTINRRNFLAALALGSAAGALGAESRIRVGQIGTQHSHASGKMEAVRGLPDLYEVVGVAGTDKGSAKAYEGVPRMSEDALLADPSVQAVLIENRIEDSCAAAQRAIQAGKHIHLDKPGGLEHGAFKAMRLEAEKMAGDQSMHLFTKSKYACTFLNPQYLVKFMTITLLRGCNVHAPILLDTSPLYQE